MITAFVAVISGLFIAAIDVHLAAFPHTSTPILVLVSLGAWLSIVVGFAWIMEGT